MRPCGRKLHKQCSIIESSRRSLPQNMEFKTLLWDEMSCVCLQSVPREGNKRGRKGVCSGRARARQRLHPAGDGSTELLVCDVLCSKTTLKPHRGNLKTVEQLYAVCIIIATCFYTGVLQYSHNKCPSWCYFYLRKSHSPFFYHPL